MLRKIRTGVAIALLAGASFAVHAAGLGKLTVSSALGQVLAAEVDLVSIQPGELDSLTARVASPESYRDAKIEYASVLRLLRFSVEKRANGQPYLKVTSVAPINEPFVDVLIEVTWPAGRLQREYPILLDPPGFAEARSAAPAAAAPDAAPSAAPVAVAAPTPESPAPIPSPGGAPSAKTEMAAAAPAAGKAAGRDTYGPVEKGETLSKIAGEVKAGSLSMEQMLVALYRENRAAFIDNNMNLLKAGQILRVPSEEEVGKISGKEANEEVRTHVSNWKAYRESLAGGIASMPARAESTRVASGQVGAAAVSPPPSASADPKDVLKLSKTEGAKGAAAAAGKGASTQDRLSAMQEELTAKDQALKEAQSRVSDLERQIRDMQRLVDLKGAVPAKPGEPAKVPDTKMAAAPAPKAEPPKAEPPTEEAKPAPMDTKVAEAPKAAEPPKPAEAAKPPAPKPAPKKAAPPPPPPEPDLMDQLLDNPAIVAGGVGGLGLVLLGGFLFVRNRRRKAEAGPSSAMTSAFPSDLKPSTGTGKAGGGLVDTGNSSFLTDFDKTGPGSIDTDEVDPVAEAEVYIAYGRDAQAEEILKEAMARDKNRHEISLKLLEIYHARKSATAFETVAKELRGAVGESSALWQKAAAMGAQIDPTNPLYGGAPAGAAAAAMFETSPPAAKPNLDFDLDSSSSSQPSASAAPQASSFDLDLGTGKASEPEAPASSAGSGLDFDLAPSAPSADVPLGSEPQPEEKPAFDFDLSGIDFPSSPSSTPGASSPDLNLSDDKAASAPAPLNLTDLDLGEGGDAGGGDGVGTKLELAKAYLEIGDKDGAREILQEVAKEGSAAQIAEAQKLIASL
ncbi:MAG: FimV/HubP family polar landmark protein [Burkholderiales bacterium]